MRVGTLSRLTGILAIVATIGNGLSPARAASSEVRVLDAKQFAGGLGALQRLAARPSVPATARDSLRSMIEDASGSKFKVTPPAAGSLAESTKPLAWRHVRTVATVNQLTYVLDRSLDFSHIMVHIVPSDRSAPVSIDANIARDPERHGGWIARWSKNGERAKSVTYFAADDANECRQHCITAGIAASLIAGLFCVVAIPSSWMVGTLMCVALGVIFTADIAYVCDTVVQSCDDDPTRTIFHMPPATLSCPYYDACDVRGVFSAHMYDAELTAFGAHLSFWFNPEEFGFNVYHAADLNLQETAHYFTQTAWRYDAFLVMSGIPMAYCTKTATFFIWAVWGTEGSAQSQTAVPKSYSVESCEP